MDPTLKQILITVGMMILAAVVSALGVWFWRQKDARNKLSDRLSELEKQLAIVGTQIAPFNTAYQSMLIKQLTHYHTPVMDALMVKLGGVGVPPTITEEEEAELIEALKQRTEDMGPEISEDERDAAEILPIVMRRVKREAEAGAQGAKIVDIQVVGRIETGENEG